MLRPYDVVSSPHSVRPIGVFDNMNGDRRLRRVRSHILPRKGPNLDLRASNGSSRYPSTPQRVDFKVGKQSTIKTYKPVAKWVGSKPKHPTKVGERPD